MRTPAEQYQRTYYERTACCYDENLPDAGRDEHYLALEFIDMLCDRFRLATLLDVGAGTGRAVKFLLDRQRDARGVEPVPAMIQQAETRGVPSGRIVEGSGYSIPFENEAFDAVYECAVLHHVADPARMVAEMLRVAKKAVFLSDINRFGHGCFPVRILKLLLYKCGLWPVARFLQTKGKMYAVSEGDGLAYSYSVFDSYSQVAAWADTIWLVPTGKPNRGGSWLHPLLTNPHVLLCALKGGGATDGPVPSTPQLSKT